jgi:hypothetical protein
MHRRRMVCQTNQPISNEAGSAGEDGQNGLLVKTTFVAMASLPCREQPLLKARAPHHCDDDVPRDGCWGRQTPSDEGAGMSRFQFPGDSLVNEMGSRLLRPLTALVVHGCGGRI